MPAANFQLISYSRKITCHTHRVAHPFGKPPKTSTMKGIPENSLLVMVARGVFQRCVETTFDLWKGLIDEDMLYVR